MTGAETRPDRRAQDLVRNPFSGFLSVSLLWLRTTHVFIGAETQSDRSGE